MKQYFALNGDMLMAYRIVLNPASDLSFHTAQIQQHLDACRDANGGEVVLAAGEWRIASLRLYSNTTFRLLPGAHVTASKNWQDYTDFHVPSTMGYLKVPYMIEIWHLPPHYLNAPITAIEAENVAVIGSEDSFFDGSDCYDAAGEEKFRGPMGMVFCKCKNVHLEGYLYKNAANWCHQLDSCENVLARRVTVQGGHDGINIHHCRHVVIEDCVLETGDDCVAGYNAQDVTVRNCVLNTSCSTFRIGGRDLLVENCILRGPGVYPHRVSGRHNTLAVFEYYAMRYDDAITLDSTNWIMRNCVIDQVDTLFHYEPANDFMHCKKPLRDVTFENVQITGLLKPSVLIPEEHAPLDLTFTDCTLTWRNETPVIPDRPYVRCHIHNSKEVE